MSTAEPPDGADPVVLLQALIRCPSVTPAEAGALSLIESVLKPHGFVVERPVFETPGTQAVENLFARFGSGTPHFVFAGHVDVVPPGDEARWTRGPFSGDLADGEIWGRGAVDMKGGLAAAIAAGLRFLKKRGDSFPGTISYLVTGDEEGAAVNGTAKLLAWAAARGEKFDACILGEPTNPEALGDMLKIGRRGSLSGTIRATGTQGHVAYPELADNPVKRLVAVLANLAWEPLDEGNARFPPSNLEIVSVDTGNPSFNVIPAEARARFNIRFNDEWTAQTLAAHIEARVEALGEGHASVTFMPSNAEAFVTEPGPLIEQLSSAIEAETGFVPELSTSGGTSDARFIKDYCPVVEFGLVGRTMHQVNERVAVADLERLTRIYERFLEGFFAVTTRLDAEPTHG